MDPRVLPYLPSPRPAAPDMGRRPAGSRTARAIGLAEHLAGIMVFVAVPAVLASAAIACLLASEWLAIFRAAGFIVLMSSALVYLKSLLPRRLPAPAAVIVVMPRDEATAYAFVARVAELVGAPVPRRLWIGSGAELALRGRRSLLDLIRIGRCDLEVGLWLWHGLTMSEFQAVVARTLAPLSRGRFEQLRYSARAVLAGLVDGRDFVDELAGSNAPLSFLARLARGCHAPAVFPLRLLGRFLLNLGTVRDDAMADDLAAVRIAGSDALVHAVLRADFAGATLREADRLLEDAAENGVFTRDIYAHASEAATELRIAHNDFTLGETPTLRGPNAGKYADVFEPGQAYLSRMWGTLPAPAEREQNAKRTFVACEREDSPASSLLDDAERPRERLTALRYADVLGVRRDYLSLPAEVMSRWLRDRERRSMPTRYAGAFDDGRPIDLGAPSDRAAALRSDSGSDARLLAMAAGLYANAGERAARWRTSRAALNKVLRRSVYRPTGRDRAMAEDLEDDLRKIGKWLGALDRWAYVVHVHMAARLPNLGRHDELLVRYERVARLSSIAADAREYHNRVLAFARLIDEFDGMPPYRLGRDAAREFKASRKDLDILLKEIAAIDDPIAREWIGDVPLDQFLFAHRRQEYRRRLPSWVSGRGIVSAWVEVVAKSQWLYWQALAALLTLHETIEEEFAAQVGPIALTDEPFPDAIILDPPATNLEIDDVPDVVELEVIDEPEQAGGVNRAV